MRKVFALALADATTLDEVFANLLPILEGLKRGHGQVGCVIGIMTSDGPDHFERNCNILLEHTLTVRERYDFPVFCAVEVFSADLYQRINRHQLANQDFIDFWRKVHSSGYITHLIVTPRSYESTGARDEIALATMLGLKLIHLPTNNNLQTHD